MSTRAGAASRHPQLSAFRRTNLAVQPRLRVDHPNAMTATAKAIADSSPDDMPVTTYRDALRSAMAEEMERDERSSCWAKISAFTADPPSPMGCSTVRPSTCSIPRSRTASPAPRSAWRWRHATDRRNDDLELLVSGRGPDHPERRQAALLLRGQVDVRWSSATQTAAASASAQHTHTWKSFYGRLPGLKFVSGRPDDVKGMMLTAIRDPNRSSSWRPAPLRTEGEVPASARRVRQGPGCA